MIGTPRIGIELGARTVRAVRLSTGPRRRGTAHAVEIEWDQANPQDLAASLREHLGEGARGRIAVALDLPLLFVKQVKLPPLGAVEKRRVVSLEPERFLATRAEDVVAVARAEDNLIFATPEESVTAWIAALEELAPVEIVEPGPLALGRALARAGVADAIVLRDCQPGVGLVVLRGGRIDRARRVFGGLREAARVVREEPAPPDRLFLTPWTDEGARLVAAEIGGASPEPLPEVSGVSPQFLPAFGAALAIDRPPDGVSSLAPAELTARIGGRRRRERLLAIAAGLAALIFAVSSADAWRVRALGKLQQQLPAWRDRAAPALALQSEIQSLAQEAQTIRAIAVERPEPLRVLAALTRRLPAGAFVRSLRFAGSDWQIDGYAPNAAHVLSELGGAPEFADLHFFAATTRITLGSRTYETFALAFRFAPAR